VVEEESNRDLEER
jgi:hypothetical protein